MRKNFSLRVTVLEETAQRGCEASFSEVIQGPSGYFPAYLMLGNLDFIIDRGPFQAL